MNRTLNEQLNDYIQQHPELAPKKSDKKRSQKPKKHHSERLSRSEIESLMRADKPILRRGKGGVWK